MCMKWAVLRKYNFKAYNDDISVTVSGMISMYSAISLVAWSNDVSHDNNLFIDTLQHDHIPRVRRAVGGPDFTIIIVTALTPHTRFKWGLVC